MPAKRLFAANAANLFGPQLVMGYSPLEARIRHPSLDGDAAPRQPGRGHALRQDRRPPGHRPRPHARRDRFTWMMTVAGPDTATASSYADRGRRSRDADAQASRDELGERSSPGRACGNVPRTSVARSGRTGWSGVVWVDLDAEVDATDATQQGGAHVPMRPLDTSCSRLLVPEGPRVRTDHRD